MSTSPIQLDRKADVTGQLFRSLRTRIAVGEWPVNSPLPAVRDLARQYGVSVTTVQRTLAKLEARHLIETSPGRKSIVRAHRSRVVRRQVPVGSYVAIVRELMRPEDLRKRHPGWTSGIITAVEMMLHHRGLQPMATCLTTEDADAAERLGEQFDRLGDKLVGTICFPTHGRRELPGYLERRGLPFVTINRTDLSCSHNFVSADYTDAGRRIGCCFAEMGLRRILLAGERFDMSVSWHEVATGITQSLLAYNVPLEGVRSVRCSGHEEPPGYEAVREFLERNEPPQMIVAAGDHLAFGAIRACRERGLVVPDQVQVIGGAGEELAEFASPPLSVIAQPVTQIGREAAMMLLEMLDTGLTRLPGRVLPTPIVLRGSTKVPNRLSAMMQDVASPSLFPAFS